MGALSPAEESRAGVSAVPAPHSREKGSDVTPQGERENQRSQRASTWSKIKVIKQNDMYDVNRGGNQQVCTKSNFLSVWKSKPLSSFQRSLEQITVTKVLLILIRHGVDSDSAGRGDVCVCVTALSTKTTPLSFTFLLTLKTLDSLATTC